MNGGERLRGHKRVHQLRTRVYYWLSYWHTLIQKDTSGLTSDTLLIRIQSCYQLIKFTELIKFMRRMVKSVLIKLVKAYYYLG